MKGKVETGCFIKLNAYRDLFNVGMLFPRRGIFLRRRADRYTDLLINIVPVPYEINRVKIIGRNRSTLAVVSSIITANANVILVAPDNTAVAPMIEKKEGLMPDLGSFGS